MNDDDLTISDIGTFDLPDFDEDCFDIDLSELADDNNRYLKPRLVPMRSSQIIYEKAQQSTQSN